MPRLWAETNPKDIDNLQKAAFDALTGIVWTNDNRIVSVVVHTVLACGDVKDEPGVHLVVEDWSDVLPPVPGEDWSGQSP